MEVDVAPVEQVAEAEYVIDICRSRQYPTVPRSSAAGRGGRFREYILRYKDSTYVKGVRQVLLASKETGRLPRQGVCRFGPLAGRAGHEFRLCGCGRVCRRGEAGRPLPRYPIHPRPLRQRRRQAFRRPAAAPAPSHDPEAWKKDIAQLAKRKNLICKISGIVARVSKQWTAEDLAPIVNHCLDSFGPDRVVFGGDWPVCPKGATLPAMGRGPAPDRRRPQRGRAAEAASTTTPSSSTGCEGIQESWGLALHNFNRRRRTTGHCPRVVATTIEV